MARPERRIVLAGESPVRVSAGAPGSRLQPGGEIRPSRAECQKPLPERGANQRAATISERCSHVILSAERCLRGPSRSCRGEGNRQHSWKPERMLDLSGVAGGGTLEKSEAEQERPYQAALSGKDRWYKAGRVLVFRLPRSIFTLAIPIRPHRSSRPAATESASLTWTTSAARSRSRCTSANTRPRMSGQLYLLHQGGSSRRRKSQRGLALYPDGPPISPMNGVAKIFIRYDGINGDTDASGPGPLLDHTGEMRRAEAAKRLRWQWAHRGRATWKPLQDPVGEPAVPRSREQNARRPACPSGGRRIP